MAAVVLLFSLIAAPLVWHRGDFFVCWLPWARASEGVAPWRIYTTQANCNYPPFFLYLLTAGEAVRRHFQAPEIGSLAVILVKLPGILAHATGAVAGYFLLRKTPGETYARRFAFLYALSLPLFVNSSVWGQTDVLIALPMVCAVALLMRGSPVRAGVAIGFALAIKLQAIVIAPALLLYAWKKFGRKPFIRATLAGSAIIFASALPFLIAGAAGPMIKSYTGAADFYKLRTVEAFNLWKCVNYFDEYVRHVPPQLVNSDDRAAIGFLTYRDVGLALFVLALSFLLVCLWRRTTPRMLAWTAALSVWAFVALCTQMHDRYWVPGAALFLLLAPESWFTLSFALIAGFTSAYNQWLSVCMDARIHYSLLPFVRSYMYFGGHRRAVLLSLINLLLLGVGMAYIGRLALRGKNDAVAGGIAPSVSG